MKTEFLHANGYNTLAMELGTVVKREKAFGASIMTLTNAEQKKVFLVLEGEKVTVYDFHQFGDWHKRQEQEERDGDSESEERESSSESDSESEKPKEKAGNNVPEWKVDLEALMAKTDKSLARMVMAEEGRMKRAEKERMEQLCSNGHSCGDCDDCMECGIRCCFWRVYGEDRICENCEEEQFRNGLRYRAIYRP